MRGQVLILSRDAVFARMLQIEIKMMQIEACVREAYGGEAADVVLCDLDSVPPTPAMTGLGIIGFTRHFEVSHLDPNRLCAMILHRPFEMRMLREELRAFLESDDAGGNAEPRTGRLLLEGSDLICNGQKILLSPKESLVMRALIEASPAPVSRERLAELVGESAGNKTDVYVCFLRRKLSSISEKPLIRTVRGCGYALIC